MGILGGEFIFVVIGCDCKIVDLVFDIIFEWGYKIVYCYIGVGVSCLVYLLV